METYNGLVRTPTDAIILFEACRLGILPRVQRRLSEKERQSIRSGSVFVWDEREAGMRRWTDGKSWSASRVSGSFLTYREMEGKRGGNSYANPASRGTKTPENGQDDPSQAGEGEEGPDGYRYKPDGLMKQSFSITTSTGQHLHLISYYSRSHPTSQVLRQPSTDPNLASIQPAKGMYPESTINDQSTVPAVTRSPMLGAPGYVVTPGAPGYHRPSPAPPQAYIPPGYIPHPAYIYPISPMHTPPPGHYLQPYALQPGLPPLAYSAAPYPSPHPLPLSQAPPSSFDQRPLRDSDSRPSAPFPLQPTTSPQAPLSAYPGSQPPPPLYQSSPAPPVNYQGPETSNENVGSGLQIDPRLTATANGGDAQTNGANTKNENHSVAQPSDTTTVSASQAPTITALVHNIDTNVPPVAKGQPEAEVDRQGSTSPGGTKNGAPPQDIPSEKLGFREDKRALSKLDRVFAKV
ncbi:uncharacterized protein Z520_01189 [Fonsecaea multimorphosa CBS 102226]|uniref:cAMP-independent regulatory protein pac2 n=1 Tax=Fonsecaea multimorphosa CBS 102226 TaxID=1442371 RepID=A0A0D2L111_9EURO|nr:uncharacterized protein Z520_01189 [Fonsecaea multimorphosa CBS 102226]KIY02724.1 hypothetical protein Z520_01189 [Fonsecaea multimorphosa CBS 102226]OAL31585.1 hypothetical protein AYO22_01177 [Fonsecaea multimorphosa]